jgi:hypothetical protein
MLITQLTMASSEQLLKCIIRLVLATNSINRSIKFPALGAVLEIPSLSEDRLGRCCSYCWDVCKRSKFNEPRLLSAKVLACRNATVTKLKLEAIGLKPRAAIEFIS